MNFGWSVFVVYLVAICSHICALVLLFCVKQVNITFGQKYLLVTLCLTELTLNALTIAATISKLVNRNLKISQEILEYVGICLLPMYTVYSL